MLRNSLDPDPDSRSSRSGLRFLAGYGFNWTWIRNTGFYKLFYKQFCTYCMYGSLIEYNWSNNNMPGYYNLCVRPFIFFCSYKSCSCFVHISILVLFSMICLFFLFTYWPNPRQNGMPIIRKRKKIKFNEVKKDKKVKYINCRTEIVKSIGLVDSAYF